MQAVPRSQMAIFLANAIARGGTNVPAAGSWNGGPYNCAPGGASRFSDVLPTDAFCKHVHFLAVQNVTLGCGPTLFCPNGTVSRLEMAAFVAKGMRAPSGGTGVPSAYGPDPATGRSYDCGAAPSTHFTDVPAGDPFCKHVHYLWARGVVSGCAPTQYCPASSVLRGEMAKFLANGFALKLY